MDSPTALAYFAIHAEADIHHREGERQTLLRYLAVGAPAKAVLGTAEQALQAYWGVLDGVCAEGGIPRAV